MAKSRKRKGHNKRIQSRKNALKAGQMKMQKMFNEAMEKEMEALKKQYEESQSESSGTTEPESIQLEPVQS